LAAWGIVDVLGVSPSVELRRDRTSLARFGSFDLAALQALPL
jgi:hypothetical protein